MNTWVLLVLLCVVGSGFARTTPADYARDMMCAAPWALAEQASTRTLTAEEVKAVAVCAPAGLRLLHHSLLSIRSSGSRPIQRSLTAGLTDAPDILVAGSALVEAFRHGTPDAVWYSQFWSRYDTVGLAAAEILLEGQIDHLRSAITAAGEGGVASACSVQCEFFAAAAGLPQSPIAQVDYIFEQLERRSDPMIGVVLLTESSKPARDRAFELVSAPWPSDPFIQVKRSWQALCVYLALRAAGDARFSQVGLSRAIPAAAVHATLVKTPFNSNPDLHFTREAFLIRRTVQKKKKKR